MSETRINQMTTVQKEALELFRKKNTDYGDAFATYGTVGVIVRMGDKIQRLNSVSSKSSGTQKRDAVINRFLNKETGNLSLKQIDFSFKQSVIKGNMKASYKEAFLKEIKGRLSNLEKMNIAQKVDNFNYKIDIQKWNSLQQQLNQANINRIENLNQKAFNTVQARFNSNYSIFYLMQNSYSSTQTHNVSVSSQSIEDKFFTENLHKKLKYKG